MPQPNLTLNFAADFASTPEPAPAATPRRPTTDALAPLLDLPPTWSEHSRIFHTAERCTRLQSIRRNRRVTGSPGSRDHCLNCIAIAATLRRG